jgi:hypothetical protein
MGDVWARTEMEMTEASVPTPFGNCPMLTRAPLGPFGCLIRISTVAHCCKDIDGLLVTGHQVQQIIGLSKPSIARILDLRSLDHSVSYSAR